LAGEVGGQGDKGGTKRNMDGGDAVLIALWSSNGIFIGSEKGNNHRTIKTLSEMGGRKKERKHLKGHLFMAEKGGGRWAHCLFGGEFRRFRQITPCTLKKKRRDLGRGTTE